MKGLNSLKVTGQVKMTEAGKAVESRFGAAEVKAKAESTDDKVRKFLHFLFRFPAETGPGWCGLGIFLLCFLAFLTSCLGVRQCKRIRGMEQRTWTRSANLISSKWYELYIHKETGLK